jgi:hypothetical protein
MLLLLMSLTTLPKDKRNIFKRMSMAAFDASANRTLFFFVSTRSLRVTLVEEEEEEEAILKGTLY